MGIETALDLLQHYPRRYHDRTQHAEIAQLSIGDEATVFAEVRRIRVRRTRNRRPIVEAVVYDGTDLLNIVFFNQPWRERQLAEGTEAAFFGKLELYRGKRQMTNPVVDVLDRLGERTGVIVPVYPQSGKADVSTWQLRPVVAAALDWAGDLADPLPLDVRREFKLVDRTWAYRHVHQPEDLEEARRAQRRLRFDEFLRMQVGLVARKRAFEAEESGIRHQVDGPLVDAFVHRLPFALTDDQQRAIDDIAADLSAPSPMHRLLQGEVGSGKTVVALAALLIAVQGGYQGAFMAPTEVLAEQHYLGSRELLAGLTVPSPTTLMGERPVTVALLTNRTSAADRRRMAAELAAGEIDVVVGTHALIYGEVGFARLGLAVIDEQHRFGVEQRAVLRGMGDEPDVLVMTATPIPRTAGFLIYGDLDKSELRTMPPGRTPVTTEAVGPGPLERAGAYDVLRREVADGHQAYVVCPLVEGSPRVEPRPSPRADEGGRQGGRHGRLPRRRPRRARRHDGDRGRCRRGERHRDDRRGCRSVRVVAAPSAAGPGRPWESSFPVLPVRRPDHTRGPGAPGRHGRFDRRVRARRTRPRDPGRG
jgi:ATP-dependent DNA helicase RecG